MILLVNLTILILEQTEYYVEIYFIFTKLVNRQFFFLHLARIADRRVPHEDPLADRLEK